MNAELGTPVATIDGHGIGPIDALIVDRATRRVCAVAVREGFFVRHEVRVVLADLIVGLVEDLRCSSAAADLASLPRFRPHEHPAGALAAHARMAVATPHARAGEAEPARAANGHSEEDAGELAEMHRQPGVDNAFVGPGSRVVGSDSARLGSVERISFDLLSGEIGSVTFRGGFFGSAEHAVAGEHVIEVDDDLVVLDIPHDQLERLSVRPT